MHIIAVLVLIANSQLSEYFGIAKKGMVTLALFFMIIVIVNDCIMISKTENNESENV